MNEAPVDPREPVAIIGIGCRFPGAEGPQAFWRLLRDGVDAVTEVPSSRFNIDEWHDPRPGTPGKIVTRGGGFLPKVDQFDAAFFGISPREASKMDPQQRMLLEVAWEALEDGGQVPSRLIGSRTGVFISTIYNDYEDLLIREPKAYDIYAYTGGARSSLSGRLSYCLGLRGPSVVVDTACSSALVAIHLACQSLWSGESPMALAGACNLLLMPELSLGFSSAKMLAPDGRCKAFDARGNGFVRSDGVGMVALKPLSAARADGDPIYAVIRGTAVNNDGKCQGFMTPSREGQEELLREAYRSAGVNPSRVQYIEAHGTGTSVGDPIEVGAIGAVVGRNRPKDRPCFLGSVKTNIGHTEGAAGMAGIIKVALAMKNGELPKSLHLDSPNPAIPWSELPLSVVKERMPWPKADGPRLAGVSSFGISGTNAHVVVEEAPPLDEVAATDHPVAGPQLLTLSAQTSEALKGMAESYQRLLSGQAGLTPPAWDQLCYTASVRREHHDHRLALVARDHAEAAEQLQAFLGGEARANLSNGVRRAGRQRKVVFVFPGQGSQWAGMGRQLLETEPVFRGVLERCDRRMRGYIGGSIIEELLAPPEKSRLDEIGIVQPALFAIEVALAALWQSWGVDPDAVVGHSMGEVAAAHVAGALSLADAAQIICRRSGLMRQVAGQGAMAAVDLTLDEARAEVAGVEEKVSIAVSNGPQSTVLSGDPVVLEQILTRLKGRGVFCRPIKVTVASHSPQMEPLKEQFFTAMKGLAPKPAQVPFCSTVVRAFGTEAADGLELNAEYWWNNLRQPVLFFDAVQVLLRNGHDIFIEMSPHPILAMPLSQSIAHAAKGGTVLPSLRREEDERAVMLGSFGALYTQGREMEFDRLHREGGKVVTLPPYAWQRERFWFEAKGSTERRDAHGRARPTGGTHPLLGPHIISATDSSTHLWEMDLSVDAPAYLVDHKVQGAVVLPGAAYLEMALAAATEALGPKHFGLEKVSFKKALVLPEGGAQTVQLVFAQESAATASFRVFARPADKDAQEPWNLLCQGMLRIQGAPGPVPTVPAPEDLKGRLPEPLVGEDHYRDMKQRGLEYGPAFQAVQQVWRRNGEALALLKLPEALTAKLDAYHVHPALLDAALQVAYDAMPKESDGQASSDTWLPVGVRSLKMYGRPGTSGYALAALRPVPGTTGLEADIRILDDTGHVAGEVLGLSLQRLEADSQRATERKLRDWLYKVRWQPLARPSRAPRLAKRGSWLVFVDHGGVGKALAALLAERGERCVLVSPTRRPKDPFRQDGDRVVLRPGQAEDYRKLLQGFLTSQQPPLRGIVHLWSLDAPEPEDTNIASLEESQSLGALSLLHLTQALGASGLPNAPRVWLVTSGSQRVEDAEQRVAVAQAPAWGMAGVIAYEHPDLRPVRVDLGREPALGEIRSLFHEIVLGGEEDQVALRGDARYVARLDHVQEEEIQSEARGPSRPATGKERAYKLEIPKPGVLDHLTFRPSRRRRPAPGEVEIEVCAAGLNFRDVMLSLGLIPPIVEGRMDLGWECAGRISAVGEGVRDLSVGDEVVAVAPPCFGSHAVAPAALVHKKPAHLSMAEAATIPIAFLTAYYALHHQGRLLRGERVLIHAATGGVGLAAVQIAQWAQAEVFATAGNPVKREFLQGLGIHHVMDSRSLSFAENIMDVTSGEGVDVVLNSLSGDFIPRSFSLLRAGGRFLELGNVDMVRNTAFGLRNFQNNRSFYGVNLGSLALQQPQRCGLLLGEILSLFEQGVFTPLPLQAFPVAHAQTAFRHMAQAKHIGKVVIQFEDQPVVTHEPQDAPLEFAEEATYLITGGMGGLGLAVAQWMISRGARHLVLMGRHGPTATAQAVIDGMRRTPGTEVAVVKADVADERQVAGVLTAIARRLPPLKGIFHAAGFLDDGILLQMDPERFKSVMAPKLLGAWNLHALTQDVPLDHFVLFSSAASVLGSPGQANYVAGNSFLDALAAHRQALKLPALSINWCPWSEVGLAARSDRGGRLALRGLGSISPKEGISVLERLLRQPLEQVAVMPFDVEQWTKFHPPARQLQMFAELARAQTEKPPEAKKVATPRQQLLAIDATGREGWLETYLREQVSKALRLPATKLDARTPLNKLGIDSLMAVELNNRIEADLGATVPVVKLLEGITVTEVAAHLLKQLPPPGEVLEAQADGAADAEDAAAEAGENSHPDGTPLSGEAVEALLEEMVETGRLPAVAGRPDKRNRIVHRVGAVEVSRGRAVKRRPSLESEVVLDPAIVPSGPVLSPANPENVFVTGGTGFLGAFLVHDLLKALPTATAHCLVRAGSEAEGRKRLKQTLELYRLWDDSLAPRIVPVLGDLGKPLLGLTPRDFGVLAERVDSIYHSGALVNFLFSYEDAKPSNVQGTHEMLRLACQGRVKPFHHISSLSVFSTDDFASKRALETDELPRSEGLLMGGYAQSKWVSEKLVMAGRARGIPASIYRPVFISWHTQTGVFHKTDFLCGMIRGCLMMGAAPDLDMVVPLAPVDFVSRAIVNLSKKPEALGNNFHLCNPQVLLWNELMDVLRSSGSPLERLPYREWRARLWGDDALARENPLRIFAPLFPEEETGLSFFEVMSERRMPLYDWQNVQLGLAGTDIRCPPIDETLLRVFLNELLMGAGAVAQQSRPPLALPAVR